MVLFSRERQYEYVRMRKLTIVIKRKRSAFGPADGIELAGGSYSLVPVSISKFKECQRLGRDQENKRIHEVNSGVSAPERTESAFEFFDALQGLRMRSCLSFLSLPISNGL